MLSRILYINLLMFLGIINGLFVLMYRTAVNQSINQIQYNYSWHNSLNNADVPSIDHQTNKISQRLWDDRSYKPIGRVVHALIIYRPPFCFRTLMTHGHSETFVIFHNAFLLRPTALLSSVSPINSAMHMWKCDVLNVVCNSYSF